MSYEYRRLQKNSADNKQAYTLKKDSERPLIRPRNDWCLAIAAATQSDNIENTNVENDNT